MNQTSYEQDCSIMRFVGIFSGKWILPIAFHLIEKQAPVRFGELQKALAPITQKELSKHLKILEKHQLITKKVYAEVPPKVEYQISDLGRTLKDPIYHLGAWMEIYEDKIRQID
ncbi:winged helix-turn-helix transcriptional regulator [Acinetobacter stercoris]|uniref:Putative HTH-type transcriptional regulator YybR n=1 Tax=Acinetobacter stercoris TaxID=2126983 RepID=A0A2U3MVW6_9GAMM|nr:MULTISPECIES: helix-turn-helix domain-containing protein [Acinetobacter]SPL69572.1 putative HTH-type transcriptional regulator YybR [Acinetobacter stercoris]